MTEAEWLASDEPKAMLEYLTRDWGARPDGGVRHLPGSSSRVAGERKLRLFACACWRACPPESPTAGWSEALSQLGEIAEGEREAFSRKAEGYVCASLDVAWLLRHLSGLWVGGNIRPVDRGQNRRVCAALIREIVGNPYRQYAWTACHDCRPSGHELQFLDERWRTPTVLSVASRIYQERDFDALPVMADALEDAGCTDEEILRHCRGRERCGSCELQIQLSGGGRGRVTPAGAFDAKGNSLPPRPMPGCVHCKGTGWRPLRGPHVRGCWALGLVLGKE